MIGFGIRPFRHEDRDAVAEVCVKTADAGTDATGMFRDDRLWADVFALPYVERHPDLAWVVEAPGAGVVGYVLGVADTDAFETWFRDEWWPSRVGAYAESDAVIPSREAEILRYAGARAPGTLSATAEYPAHLHIDLLPAAQGQGLGRKLTDALFAALRERGVPGLHVGVDPRNTGAAAFYQRLGFERLPSAPGVLLLGIRLA
ncbi:GNAT family N-acetyltransferase [Microbacterium sp. NIBRBAC000506063]|nr:GNAT family N-acetyltransferase [Microbacterium sp. NIBRBAC000506063]QTV80680.1 GNAT family N-acetyltransferase [Microbacterium sp. NIBRBAC000506063]